MSKQQMKHKQQHSYECITTDTRCDIIFYVISVCVSLNIILCVFYSRTESNKSPQIFKIKKSEQEFSNCHFIVNRQVYFMTTIVSVSDLNQLLYVGIIGTKYI